MRSYVALRVFLFTILSFVVSIGWAGPKEEVAAASAKWANVFTDDDPEKILALYDKEGVLWGTLSPKRRDDQAALRDYFVKAYAALPGHKVTFGDQLIRVYGDTAVNTGYYNISYTKDGETKTLPAPLQFHLCQKRKRLAHRGSSFVRDA